MGFFTETTRRVEIDEENYIVIRRLTYGERQRILSLATKASVPIRRRKPGQDGEEEDQDEMVIDTARLQLEQIKAGIVSWSGPGFEGRPVTGANVEALPTWIVDLVALEMEELNQGLNEREKKLSTAPTSS